MAEAAVTFLLQNTRDMVVYQIELSRAAKGELEKLQKELELMNAVLEDAADEKSKGKAFRIWEKQIREVVYEAEDLIDSCMIQEQADRKKKFKLSTTRIDLAEKLKNIRVNKIEPIFKTAKSDLAILRGPDEPDLRTKKTRQVEPLLDKTVVGFEDEIETLISNLRENCSEVEAISIIGMPGLGKTTVASKIFRDSSIDFDFPTRIWVNVSDEYTRRDIYLTIVKKFTSQDFSTTTDLELALKAQEHLSQVKFLLVLDDVWTVEAWNDIKLALPIKKGSGKVLITSRIEKVATNANAIREPHRLRFLTEEESWKLLQLEVYGKEGVWPEDLETIGKNISLKCGGLPLALVVIGGILLDKISPPETRKVEWKEVSQRAEEYLLVDDKDKEKSVRNIIALSYDKMPYYLRSCFLYLAVYPRDFDISVWKLTRLWIAEGFIKEGSKSLEDIAEENLKELIRRNLVMVVRRNAQGKVKSCRVHDMIREFCKREAEFDRLNFLQVISKSSDGLFVPDVSEIQKFRRICVHSHILEFLQEKPKGHRTRSFICFSKHEIDVPSNSLQLVTDAFELLRVFEGSSIKFPRFHIKLTKLMHLRYITLSGGDEFRILPDSIAELYNLESIVIDTSYHTFEIKTNISEMRRLRHLKTRAAIVLNGNKKKKCLPTKILQTLTRLSTQSCKDEILSMTPNIQTLGIYGELISLVNATCFAKLSSLKRLKMVNSIEHDIPIPQLLKEAQFPRNLKILSLSATNLDWHYMKTLGRMKLEVLKLKDNAFKGDEWNVSRGDFRSLQSLQIERTDLITWTIEDGSFPELTYLFLNNCEKLNEIPLGLAKGLQTLELGLVSKSALSSAEMIGAEKRKTPSGSGFKLIIAPIAKN